MNSLITKDRHDRPQRRDCPFINQEHSKQNRSRGNGAAGAALTIIRLS